MNDTVVISVHEATSDGMKLVRDVFVPREKLERVLNSLDELADD